jgi:hypothetical protein
VKNRPDALAALVIVGLVVIAVTACALVRVPVPEFLPTIGLFVAGVGGGLAAPSLFSTSSSGTSSPPPSPRPAPAPLLAEPPTGVFRPATHAP